MNRVYLVASKNMDATLKELEDYDEIMKKKVKVYDANHKEIDETTLKDKINSYIPIESDRF